MSISDSEDEDSEVLGPDAKKPLSSSDLISRRGSCGDGSQSIPAQKCNDVSSSPTKTKQQPLDLVKPVTDGAEHVTDLTTSKSSSLLKREVSSPSPTTSTNCSSEISPANSCKSSNSTINNNFLSPTSLSSHVTNNNNSGNDVMKRDAALSAYSAHLLASAAAAHQHAAAANLPFANPPSGAMPVTTPLPANFHPQQRLLVPHAHLFFQAQLAAAGRLGHHAAAAAAATGVAGTPTTHSGTPGGSPAGHPFLNPTGGVSAVPTSAPHPILRPNPLLLGSFAGTQSLLNSITSPPSSSAISPMKSSVFSPVALCNIKDSK